MAFLDDYEPVQDRLAKFWADYPNGRIWTDIWRYEDGDIVVRSAVWRDGTQGEVPDGTGWAQETVSDRGVNATSALENCETSAIGRALANLGYAAKARPSLEEMQKTGLSDSGPGDAAGVSPGRAYPVDPANCSHRFPSGAWLPWDKEDRCPKCGTPRISAIEGTNADLGAL